MAIWYMNIMDEDMNKQGHNSGMKVFQYIASQYWSDDRKRKADVGRSGDSWGVRYYQDNLWVKDELYKGHSESYAEDAAENYTLGIKDVR